MRRMRMRPSKPKTTTIDIILQCKSFRVSISPEDACLQDRRDILLQAAALGREAGLGVSFFAASARRYKQGMGVESHWSGSCEGVQIELPA